MKSHDRNQSSAKFSRLCLRSKHNASASQDSTRKSEKISKYFTSPTKCEASGSAGMDMITTFNDEQNFEKSVASTSAESPYKNSLTEIKSVDINSSINEETDFKTPKRIFKRNLGKPKSNSNTSNNAKKRGRKPNDSKKSKQMILTKTSKEKNLNKTDVNPEHLQLAIALSRSLQENHKRESEEIEAHAPSTSMLYPSTQQKVATIKETLKQFGFRTDTNRIDVQHRRTTIEKKKKKSRYQYVTPILLLRTQEEREKLISEKVSQILLQKPENVKYCSYISKQPRQPPISQKLKKHWSGDNKIFNINSFELDTLKNSDIFHVKALNISPTESKCGNLLKNWDKIPGREKSPLRTLINENVSIHSADNQTTNILENCKAKEDIIAHSSKINLDLINTATDSDNESLNKTFKTNLQIRSFVSNRSISPELFGSDDEMVVEIPEKRMQQDMKYIVTSSDDEHSSQSLLNLTPRKNKSVKGYSSVHSSPNKDVAGIENFNSESLLNVTPTKKNKSLIISLPETNKNKLDLDDVTSPLIMNKSKNSSRQISNEEHRAGNKFTSHDLSDDDLFENDNSICTFEIFSKKNDHINQTCFDLTQSSDEENKEADDENDISVLLDLPQSPNKTPNLKDTSFDNAETNINRTLENISPIISSNVRCSLSTGISEIMQKSMYFHEEIITNTDDKNAAESSRRSKSLNITEYIHNMLNEEQISVVNSTKQAEPELQQNLEASKDEIFDLTHSSPDSFYCNLPTSLADKGDCNLVTKRRKENISESDHDNTLSPVKSNKNTSTSSFVKHDSFKSTTSEDINLSQASQESICISDEELNYSSAYGTPCVKRKQTSIYKDNNLYEFSDESSMEENNSNEIKITNSNNINLNITPKTSKEALSSNKFDLKNIMHSEDYEMVVDSPMHLSALPNNSFDDNQPVLHHPRIKSLSRENTPKAVQIRKSLFGGDNLLDDSFNAVLENSHLFSNIQNSKAGPSSTTIQNDSENQNSKIGETNTTPKSEMIIKTTNITPLTNYNELDTPKIAKELQKFGLKPLKRQRGIQILKHIYESTHPIVGQTVQNCENAESDDEDHRVIKRRKNNSKIKSGKKSQSPRKHKSPLNEDSAKNELIMENVNMKFESSNEKIEIVGDLLGENEAVNELIFERKQSTKIPTCRVPLHIAWHNLVSSQPELRKNILLYEPLQLEFLYKILKEQGYKYHIQDLLTFLDKKCITIRTNQNQHRRQPRKKSKSPQKRKQN